MPKTQKPNPAQLELWKDFKAAQEDLQACLDRLGKTMEALILEGAMSPREAVKTAKRITKKSDKELRLRLIKVVREHARTKHLHWKEVFRIVYRRLYDLTGFNAAARAIAKGGKTKKIDVVEQAGLLPKALAIAGEL